LQYTKSMSASKVAGIYQLLGIAYSAQGDIEKAVENYVAAERLALAAGNREFLGKIRWSLGLLSADPKITERYLRECISILPRHCSIDTCLAILDLVHLQLSTGQDTTAKQTVKHLFDLLDEVLNTIPEAANILKLVVHGDTINLETLSHAQGEVKDARARHLSAPALRWPQPKG
jgi:tetratricopeptide (TPR) repeat protein